MDGQDGGGDGGGDGEVPVRELLEALEMPRAAIARWMDHLDAFFARHGGTTERYAGLARLTAETRAALGRDGGTRTEGD
jgi:hypothetical protein